MTDLQTFLTILASSKELYEFQSLGEGRRVCLHTKKIAFYFDKDGKFDKILTASI